MSKLHWNLRDDLNDFELGESGAQPGIWHDREALYLDGFHTNPVLRHDEIHFDCFRIQAEVAVPGPYGFIGLVFGARDSQNYELVYISPGIDSGIGEIQYDPIMNGSSTWQIYNGPIYQATARFPAGEWVKITMDVQPYGAAIYVGDETHPQLVISNLQHGRSIGRIGFWGNLPSYICNFSVEEIHPVPMARGRVDLQQLAEDSFITEWMVSKLYKSEQLSEPLSEWTKAIVEENGTLNLNRIYSATEKDSAVQAKFVFSLPEETESLLSIGFSDQIRLWINEEEVYQGKSLWDPPGSDGRIRFDPIAIPIKWCAGVNTLRAEIINRECMFGWGLIVKSGLPNLAYKFRKE
jgi:hypothetical protein